MTTKTAHIGPLHIEDHDLSMAWGRIVKHICQHTGKEVSPLIVSITGFDDNGAVKETAEIRDALDYFLDKSNKQAVDKVAFTIFPQRYWTMAGGDRHKLYDFYRKAFPRFKKMMPRKNAHGLYFERLTMFSPDAPNKGNQLETILSRYQKLGGKMQRMQLQATTYDPCRDQSGTAIQGFPCLQHVTFVPSSDRLTVNAFYATQQLFERAYGNYLGLANLGSFMAHEMGLKLERLNVFVGIEKLEGVSKTGAEMSKIIEIVDSHQKGQL